MKLVPLCDLFLRRRQHFAPMTHLQRQSWVEAKLYQTNFSLAQTELRVASSQLNHKASVGQILAVHFKHKLLVKYVTCGFAHSFGFSFFA